MFDFESIRPFGDKEVPAAAARLVKDKMFCGVVQQLYPQPGMAEKMLGVISKMETVEDFQTHIVYPLLENIRDISTDGLSYSAMDQFHPDGNYLFISNHRDIILDSAFLNVIMHGHGFRKTEIAIGDNLLIFDWIKDLMRINRSFIVKRNLGIREQLAASKNLSAYLRYALSEKNESVWLAQREGRTKDGYDQTQPALIKMLNMSNNKSFKEGIEELNIVPMAISYEIEPCGISKVAELLNRKHNPDFSKTQQDDLKSMANGFMAPKGRVHFAFGNPVNLRLDELCHDKNNNEIVQAITEYIDRRVYFNYKLWPNNFVAADLLNANAKHASKYSKEEKQSFVERMNRDIATLQFDETEAKQMYLQMYANPILNFEKHFA